MGSRFLFWVCFCTICLGQDSSRDISVFDLSLDDLANATVTAQKREEPLQETALSVTALSSRRLEAYHLTHIMRLDGLVPGLVMGRSGSDPRPAVRGVRTENVSNLQDPAIAFYADGVYRSRTTQAMVPLTDIQQIEVLRGPQGTLWGRNAFGGAVNVIAFKPDTSLHFSAGAALGRFNRIRSDGYVNTPLPKLPAGALRLSWAADRSDGMIQNQGGGDDLRDRDEDYLRLQLAFGRSLETLVRVSWWRSDGAGNETFGHHLAGIPIDPNTGLPSSRGQIQPLNQNAGAGLSAPSNDPFAAPGDGIFQQRLNQTTIDLELKRSFDSFDLKSQTAFADLRRDMMGEGDFSPLPASVEAELDRAQTLSQEITLTSTREGALEWTLGGFFLSDHTRGTYTFDERYAITPQNTPDLSQPTPGPQDFTSDNHVDTQSLAVYGQASYHLSEAFAVTGGLRYTRDRKSFEGCNNFNVCLVEGTYTDPVLIGNPAPYSDDANFNAVTWLANLSWRIQSNLFAYAQFRTGFQAGGFNSSPEPISGRLSFEPQWVDAFELGLKSTLLEERLTLNLVAFDHNFRDLLAQSFVSSGAAVTAVNGNAGKAGAKGLELEMQARTPSGFQINLASSVTDSAYEDFLLGGSFPDTVDADTGLNLLNLADKPIQLTPDWSMSLQASWLLESAVGAFKPYVSYRSVSEHATNDRNRPFDIQAAYDLWDLRLWWSLPSQAVTAEIFMENVDNEAVLNRTVIYPGGHVIQNFRDPRTYGLRFRFRY